MEVFISVGSKTPTFLSLSSSLPFSFILRALHFSYSEKGSTGFMEEN